MVSLLRANFATSCKYQLPSVDVSSVNCESKVFDLNSTFLIGKLSKVRRIFLMSNHFRVLEIGKSLCQLEYSSIIVKFRLRFVLPSIWF